MAVQTGEGTIEIIYGSIRIPAGATTHAGYLARPDRTGKWPTVLVLGPSPVPSSSVKNICRVLARHRVAAVAPDLEGDPKRDLRTMRSIVAFAANPNGGWSNADQGLGLLSFETAIGVASAFAAENGSVRAFASAGSTIDASVCESLEAASVPGLFIGSRDDVDADIDASLALRDRLTRTTFIVYPDGDAGFWNDQSAGFSSDRYDDVVDRLVTFFHDHLPEEVSP